jgi:ABC-type cobalamin/Fe3+-siderophores transport system ATPase subunit
MKLESISIKNYRSVETINIDLKPINDESYTYGLIGVNEAGKSSILKGIALTDNFKSINITLKDFYIKINPIICEYLYSLEDKEIDELLLLTTELIDKKDLVFENFRKLKLQFSFLPSDFLKPQIFAVFSLAKGNINFALNPGTEVLQFFKNKTHKTIFWTADEKHLITNTISLASFASDPDSISIPLRNCFKLAGITNIQERIDLLDDSTERESLREELGIKVTKHIKRVWPKHPIKITFDISNGNIHFHVKDDDVIGKSKTADQRSDGFRQFISFLLTLSAENINSELKNTIILLDEPETHLHPRAQEDLLKELIAITKGDNNNIVFFATHSNYMIDKTFLSRNYKITKPKDKTLIDKFDEKQSSYASVNYDVFEIVSTDYHNELFGKAQEISEIENGTEFDKKIKEIIENCPKKNYQHSKGAKFECSLPTYIRHQIHHPENDKNSKFTEGELEKSIKILLDLITKLKAVK